MTVTENRPVVDEIRLEIRDHVAHVTIDRPAVLNALDESATGRLKQIWARIESDPDLRCVVLTGAGDRAFCTGADMSTAGVGKSGLDYWAALEPDGFGGLSLRQTLDTPVIARVNGYALGGGMELVLGCDIVIAAETARFALPEPRVGRLPLDGGMVLLQRKIPYNAAMGMLFTGRKVGAAELHRFGLVNEVVPAAELDAEVEKLAERMATVPVSQLMMQKLVVNQAIEAMGLKQTQMFATIFDGITRHSPEGLNFKHRAEGTGWKQAVRERDLGTFDWTENRPINAPAAKR